MRRYSFLFLTLTLLLTGCGQRPAPEPPMTEQAVLDAYAAAAQVYDWFDLCSLPTAEGSVEADGDSYRRVDYEGLDTYADLVNKVRSLFAPELADQILSESVNYRDIGGELYSAEGARGGNLYLLDKTVEAEQAAEDRWTVTLTFWADAEDRELQADGYAHTVATVGYSKTVLHYEKTVEGWRFTDFCPSDGLDLDADTVFTINYYQDFEAASAYKDYSDWQLVCYLIHADGSYAEAPSDLLLHRFLERPEDILQVLALLDAAPYKTVYPHIDGIVAGPGYAAGNWLYFDEQMEFLNVLNNCRPETDAEQAVLDKIQAAFEAVTAPERVYWSNQFSLKTGGGMLCLGDKEGPFPWGYALTEVSREEAEGMDGFYPTSTVDCGDLTVHYFRSPDDGRQALNRMTTDRPGVPTDAGIEVGDTEEAVQAAYPDAVALRAVGEERVGADYALIYEPGGWAWCKHIAFFIQNGTVVQIELEDLIDGRLLPES